MASEMSSYGVKADTGAPYSRSNANLVYLPSISQPVGCRTTPLRQILEKIRIVPQICRCPDRVISPTARGAFLRESGGPGAVPPGNQFSGFA